MCIRDRSLTRAARDPSAALVMHASTLVARFAAGMLLAWLREPGRLAKQLSGVASSFFVPIFFVLLGVSKRRTLDSLLGANTSKGSTCDAADDRPWRTTDYRACHFARDAARNGATKRSFAVRRRSIRFRALWARRCRLWGFRPRDTRGSVHDRSFRRRRLAGAPSRGSVSPVARRGPGD